MKYSIKTEDTHERFVGNSIEEIVAENNLVQKGKHFFSSFMKPKKSESDKGEEKSKGFMSKDK